jgi:putative flippase GtrA
VSEARASTVAVHRGVRQFVKFCIVGLTSFTIDLGLFLLLTQFAHFWWPVAKTVSFSFAVTNGYVWNRVWTFRAAGLRRQREQYAMFVTVNVVGLLINLVVMKAAFSVLTGSTGSLKPTAEQSTIATIAATLVVVFWNFFANKHWTFRKPSPEIAEASMTTP